MNAVLNGFLAQVLAARKGAAPKPEAKKKTQNKKKKSVKK